jgi:superfamily I DNA and/or RNA helicase
LLETTQRKARWDGLFDLLLVDEASQMSLPEGLLAASTLHQRGQLLVVGDHRQMPPIIAHAWTQVAGPLATWAPERSLFSWLLDAKAPCIALDQSFRLHRDHAAFLQAAFITPTVSTFIRSAPNCYRLPTSLIRLWMQLYGIPCRWL